MLGLPPEDRPKFTRWASQLLHREQRPGHPLGARSPASRKMMRYVREEFRRQTRQPRGGLMAALIEAEEAGDRLSEDELVAMVFLLLAAGHETTLHQIAVQRADAARPSAAARRADGRLGPGRLGGPGAAPLRLVRPGQQAPLRPRGHRVPRPADPPRPDDLRLPRRRQQRPRRLRRSRAAGHPPPAEPPRRLRRRHPRLPRGQARPRRDRHRPGAALHPLPATSELAVPRSQIRFSARFGTRALVALPVKW